MPEPSSVLVTGAGGVIGAHVAAEYAKAPGWRVRGLSRRSPREAGWEHLAVDLRDADAARAGLADAGDVTHVVIGAYAERPTARELSEVNVGMLRNTLDGLAAAGAPLEHVTLYQGGKAYGAHMGFFNTRRRRAIRGSSSRTSTTTRRTSSRRSPPSAASG